jgi:hypothetical protein
VNPSSVNGLRQSVSSLLTVDRGRRVNEYTDSLSRAQKAHAARDWATAAARYDAVPPEHLAADDLVAYADAVWWLGRIDDNLRLNAAACDALLSDSRPAEAAWAAMLLGIFYLSRGDETLGMGWIGVPDVSRTASRSAPLTGGCCS